MIAYTKLKILLEKYGLWGTAPFLPHRSERKTGDLIRGGIGFGNFAVDFLAFSRMDPTTAGRPVSWSANCYVSPVHCFRSCDPIANRINKYLTGQKMQRSCGSFGLQLSYLFSQFKFFPKIDYK